MSASVVLVGDLPDIPPERSFTACRERVDAFAIAIPFVASLPWAADGEALLALFRCPQASGWDSVSILPDTSDARAALAALPDDQALCQWLAQQGIGWVPSAAPLALKPVHIPKPWGEEIWFTGIEQRGISQVVPVSGRPVPLHWWLAALPEYLLGPDSGRPPVLLKILSPLPDEGFGDLYLELHEEKREVYIITGVDETAWPDGRGAIRFGVNPQTLAGYPSEAAFREAFVAAAQAYESHRREVDAWLDQRRAEAGLPASEPADPAWLRAQLASQPDGWQQREEALRQALEHFTRLKPLQVGDVVQVPLRVPHSLQHGVRAVEFQTPVYERKILAFGQKVLTQSHWDSAEGAALMVLDASTDPVLPVLEQARGLQVEQVAAFEDFEVQRVALHAGRVKAGDAGCYRLLMGLSGHVAAGSLRLGPEQAWFWPATLPLWLEVPEGVENTVFLEAFPA
ncbi:MAG: hypothetical protein EP312_03595 [Gammaproteobacteria bacterium]|nr:MAG: hypothetical protein EP312_03595 [Gammaproteobacteria bacterium]